jgi:hypothetical protein
LGVYDLVISDETYSIEGIVNFNAAVVEKLGDFDDACECQSIRRRGEDFIGFIENINLRGIHFYVFLADCAAWRIGPDYAG